MPMPIACTVGCKGNPCSVCGWSTYTGATFGGTATGATYNWTGLQPSRLHPDDIEAIAKRVVEELRAKVL